ncbi:hypothetical protein A2701_00365 [Candidatus Amesbacteria bacterium RIFCSPHIGHO2_01_FULL_47_34]|uniref:GH15-like domain-containing protein n=4 Tax=Candidatus Amesiibacteriota TaxID=1752730 RepID=A0A1F4ZTK2_9BACT|nr:MAG: Glycoside hydrolase [Candidatus Amesbacteria bacterium GW2011_GWC1_47_15]KKU96942.1 MAG: Glycoside hydrolase [Candidatus Amesbacteria bacterium GW2011_GWB1_48_13]OGC98070.1 MAG: hypothetical protein A2701_00365 [Candidatus Amesbacteria bacterium RIFCSPHIGHO2_01_FULL_47_34]OGC99587.1 MAG: hypothetical protein A2972_02405 [Candidatus Amesbacteria bacterium RIFCSPLOWO2_01_FULL_47_33]OGD09156.1 MAG: hypothetical protein A2395_04230 [Candidatus Amesbacteria bacterium RIFOXYB1_FULL_47_9]
MPKSLILSNGNLLVGYDAHAQVRDFYFPFVGLENQTAGRLSHLIGVWTDESFSWLSDPGWSISIFYRPDSLTSQVTATHPGLQIELSFTDVVYNEKDIFLREITVHNLSTFPRLVKIFFNAQFEIYESFRKDTAFYDPNSKVIVHYKGRRVFVINAVCENQSFDDFSTGLLNIENREGTYADAKDGFLSKNPIEHGPVDSVIAVSLNLDPQKTKTVHYWITVSKLMEEAYELNRYVLDRTPSHLIKTTHDYWFAWVNRGAWHFPRLSAEITNLFKRSLLLIRTHADNRGGIIASCDSDMLQYGRDNYSYVWPRDGAFSVMALDRAGEDEVTRRFFRFCDSVVSPPGYFLHKFRPDQSLGSSWHPWASRTDGQPQLPIQEDATALVLYSLWSHYNATRDLEFIESIYNSLIKKSAEFLVSYRDPATKLPLPSYDLWEQDYATHTYTASTVYAALIAAGKFADLLGKSKTSSKYTTAAAEIKQAIMDHMYDSSTGLFYRSVFLGSDNPPDKRADFSVPYGLFRFGILEPHSPHLTHNISYTLNKLGLNTPAGGVARYEGDWYYRSADEVPGNPWFITTLWLAQYYLTQVQKPQDLGMVERLLSWVADHASPAGILSEQLDPHTGAPLSAAPLIWSHAEFVYTILEYHSVLSRLQNL